jgi:hypothetical protein
VHIHVLPEEFRCSNYSPGCNVCTACMWVEFGKILDKVGLPQGARGSGPFGSTFPNSDLFHPLQKMLVNYVWMLDLFHV